MNRHLIISLLTALVSLTAKASEDTDSLRIIRPVTSAYTIEAGSAKITDTYLSPLKYTGETFAFGYERFQAMKFNPEKHLKYILSDFSSCHVCFPFYNYSSPSAYIRKIARLVVLSRCYSANFAHIWRGGSIRAVLRIR